jgi:hypothetical protein
MATTHGSKGAVWLKRLCSKNRFEKKAMKKTCNSQSEIFLTKNPNYHSKTKHIDVQYHLVREMVENKKVLLEKVDTLENITNSLTKSMSDVKLCWCREAISTAAMGM